MIPQLQPVRLIHTSALILGLTLSALPTFSAPPILDARQGFTTKLLREERVGEAAEEPPASSGLKLVQYSAPLGNYAAYISADPGDGKKHPAIIWLVGGFSNSIGDVAWTPGPASNDQSASGFRNHGIVMMYPSLRGGNTNPGHIETFYGEVDDVLAAAKHLASLDYVDPKRIYLGGHSTGGTLALLAAAAAEDRFRAVFALGPVEDVTGYGADVLPFDLENPKEGQLRAPQRWLKDIKCPTFIFEGTKRGNITSLFTLQARNKNPLITFEPIQGETHFSIIAPLVTRIGRAISTGSNDAQSFALIR
jgi:acetyl esterase/lipase